MVPHPSNSARILIAAGIGVAALIGVLALRPSDRPQMRLDAATDKPRDVSLAHSRPSLDCAFNSIMHSSGVIYFYFDVAVSDGEPPRFHERAFVSADGGRQTYDGDERPFWSFSRDDDGQQTIKAPDGATQIILYGLKLGAAGEMAVEAGLRSNVFRNLGGICRQTNLTSANS